MSRSIEAQAAAWLPLRVSEAEFSDPTLLLSGDGWSLAVTCPWRMVNGEEIELSWTSEDAADRVWDLIGRSITAIRDPLFELSDGSILEVFSDTDKIHGYSVCLVRPSSGRFSATPTSRIERTGEDDVDPSRRPVAGVISGTPALASPRPLGLTIESGYDIAPPTEWPVELDELRRAERRRFDERSAEPLSPNTA